MAACNELCEEIEDFSFGKQNFLFKITDSSSNIRRIIFGVRKKKAN